MFIVSQAFFCQRTFPFLNLFADCLRVGWWVGVTWTSINKTVDTTFLFIVSDTALEQSKANICPGERSGLLIDDDHLFSEHRRWRTIKIFWSFQCDLWPQEGGVWSIDFTATTNRKIEARLVGGGPIRSYSQSHASLHSYEVTPMLEQRHRSYKLLKSTGSSLQMDSAEFPGLSVVTVLSLLACILQMLSAVLLTYRYGGSASGKDKWILLWVFYDVIVHLTLVRRLHFI